MIEQTKPVGERITGALQKRPARLKREHELKKKISKIIKEHPNKSLSVIRRWLYDDPNWKRQRFKPMKIYPVIMTMLIALAAAPAWSSSSTLSSTPVPQSATARGDLAGPGPSGVFALRTVEQWRNFQTEQRLNWPITIDFKRNMVIAVLLGTRNSGGYTAKISDVRATDWMVEVTYSEIPPQANQAVIQTLTNPYVLSVIPQSQHPVVFSRGHFTTQSIPHSEYTRLIRTISETTYQLDDERRKNAMAQGRIRDLTDLLTRTSPQPAN